MVMWISWSGKIVAAIGIFFGFYHLGDDPQRSLS